MTIKVKKEYNYRSLFCLDEQHSRLVTVSYKKRQQIIYTHIKIKLYFIYFKIIMIYKMFVKQIYLNTLISNKFRYTDHLDSDDIVIVSSLCNSTVHGAANHLYSMSMMST